MTSPVQVPDLGGTEHVPLRPHWSCRADGEQWPCEVAKVEIRAEIQAAPTAGRAFYFGRYLEACGDLAGVPEADLMHRFYAWLMPGAPG